MGGAVGRPIGKGTLYLFISALAGWMFVQPDFSRASDIQTSDRETAGQLATGEGAGSRNANSNSIASDLSSTDRDTLQKQIVEALAAGKDVTRLIERFKSLPASSSRNASPNRSNEAADLQAALVAFEQALRDAGKQRDLSAATIKSLSVMYEALQAHHLLFAQRFENVKDQLAKTGASAEFEQRRSDASRRYEQQIAGLNAALADTLGALQSNPDLPALQTAAFRSRTLLAVRKATTYLQQNKSRAPNPLLRASVLPYRQAKLAQRAPKLTPIVVPSYKYSSDAVVLPLPADTTATVDAPLSEEILRKARSLDYDYVRIYEFVRNEIRTEWYAGGMKGAVGTLRQKSGNDVDQASLLIALFRASGMPARYIHGVVELPIEDVIASIGVSDAAQATTALTRAGVAYNPVIRGGRVAAVNVEHTWVTAFVPYTNYRGAVVDVSGKIWLPLAPALKRVDVTLPTGILRTMGLDTGALVSSYLENVQSEDLIERLRREVGDYLGVNGQSQTYAQQLGASTVASENIGLIPNTLPVVTVAVTGEAAELADAYRQRVRFVVRQGTGDADRIILDYRVLLSEVASERVTLSYIPATVDDHKVTNQFGGLDYVPAYLIKLRPQIKINGRQKSIGEDSMDTGVSHRLEVHLLAPGVSERIDSVVLSGSYHAIGFSAQNVAQNIPENDPADTEYTAAKLLRQIALDYSDKWNKAESELAGLLNVALVRPLPAVAIASNSHKVNMVLGRPYQLEWQGVTLDAAFRVAEPVARTADATTAKDWMRLASLHGSMLEHKVFEQNFLVDSISADKGLALARAQNIPVVNITAGNIGSLLPTLTHPAGVKADIANWVRLGMTVDIPRDPITHNLWTGSVWRVEHAASGAAGYFISGALAGGATTEGSGAWLLQWLAEALMAANTPSGNNDPLAGVTITKIYATDGQKDEVGKELPQKIAVQVRDVLGNPVIGATVLFQVVHGGGKVEGAGAAAVETNSAGIADATFELGQKTKDFPVYVIRNPDDEYATRAGLNVVEASVLSHNGSLSISEPFGVLGLPGASTKLVPTDSMGFTRYGWANHPSGDLILVQTQDQYGNSISNAGVSVSVGGPINTCDPPPESLLPAAVYDALVSKRACPNSPILGDCGATSVELKTHVDGASAGFIFGNTAVTIHPVNVSSAGTPGLAYQYISNGECAYFTTSLHSAVGTELVNEEGTNIKASKVGTEYKGPVRIGVLYTVPTPLFSEFGQFTGFKSDSRLLRGEAQVTFEVSNGGSASGTSGVGNGVYETRVTTGPAAAENRITVRIRNISAPGLEQIIELANTMARSYGDQIRETLRSGTSFNMHPVYGLDPRIDRVFSQGTVAGEDPAALHVNENAQSRYPAELQYTVPPSTYQSSTTDVDLFEDGTWLGYIIGTTRTGSGAARLTRGMTFDSNRTYEAQVVVNRGNVAEVKSDKFRIPVFQKLFKDVTKSFLTSMDVDILNKRSCQQGSPFEFSLTDAATVTLRFTPRDTGAARTILNGVRLDRGKHTYPLLPSDLPPGKYDFELTGVSERDGHEEVEKGKAISEFSTNNRLPVGHTLVKGVDVYDGSLAVSGNDFSVPGRGPALDFRRSYGSNSSVLPGRLGVGWSHNYDSKVIITPCAEAIVIGGEGGGMRFVDNGQGGLMPLKGYHGTLIPNPADRSFDFYSKDGTRYHYRNFGTRVEWNLEFIEDVNGNITKLGYDPTSREIAKLATVQDQAGRTLKFTYEDRLFAYVGESKPVITQVEGPDGILLTFSYDENGNLVRAAREADARVEVYSYSTGTTLPSWLQHKLTSYTNPNGHVTTYLYNEETFVVPGQGMTLPTIMLPYSVVNEVKDAEGGTTGFAYNFNARTTTVTNPRARATTYTTNDYGSVVSITDPVGTTTMTWAADDVVMTSKTDARNVRTDYTYDTDGNLLTETVDGITTRNTYEVFAGRPIKNRIKTKTDRNGNTTTFYYDSKGNLLRVVDPEGGETRHTYSANGDRVETRDPNGNTSRFTYDERGYVETTIDALGGSTRTGWNDRGQPLEVTDPLGRRTTLEYDTLDRLTRKTNALNGRRSFTYDTVGNKLSETDEEGRTTTWTYDRENRVKTIRDALNNTKTFGYDPAGNKTSETDWKNVATNFEYDAVDRLIRRSEPFGKITQFSYDPVGNVLTETDALNRVTRHAYDDLNRRIRSTDALNGVREFGYDGVGNKTSEKDPLNRVVSFAYDRLNRVLTRTEPLARITKYRYDANGNRIEEIDPLNRSRLFAYDGLNRLIKRVDGEGHPTLIEYDAVGNLTRQINARLFAVSHTYDALNRRTRTEQEIGSSQLASVSKSTIATTYGYDRVGNPTSERLPNGNTNSHTYDALNRLRSTTDSLGAVLAFEYDANGNRTRETDARGNSTTKVYDDLNRLTEANMPEGRRMSYQYDLVGNKTRETDPNAHSTGFAYDVLNRLETVTDPFGRTLAYTYDAVGNRLTERNKRGHTTRFDYDDLNRLTATTDPLAQAVAFTYDRVGNKTTETDKRGTQTTYTYDNENRPLTTRKAGVQLLRVEYDELGRKKFETDANNNINTFIYDDGRSLLLLESRPLAAITQHKYDAMGDRIETRDPEGRVSTSTFDARRRMLTATNGENETTTYTYDGNGNRLTLRRPLGNTWTSVYDNANRLTRTTDPLSGATRFTYDNNGNRLTQTDANNRTTTYEYDALNRQTAMAYPDSARAEFRYDENGNRTGLTDPRGQVFSYVFDELNRETQKNYPLPAAPTGDDLQAIATQYDPNGNPTRITETYTGVTGNRVTAKTFDAFDRLTAVTDAFGKTLTYQFDANGNRTALTDPDGRVTRYGFDALNRVIAVTNAGGVTNYEYDRSSLQTKVTYPNGTNAAQTYDRARRVLTIGNRQGTATVSSYAYTYDDNGNRTQQVETNGSAAETTTYQFDTTDRLTQVAYPDKTTTYTYDAAYNRLTERTVNAAAVTETDKTYAYNNRNQLTGITDNLNSANSVAYTFDVNGNQTQKTRSGVTTTFAYDVKDQLLSVREGASTLGVFSYDYQGLRVVKDMGGSTVRYTYDDQSVLLQTDISGQTIAKYDYGTNRLLSLSHVTEGRQFYLFDALGSVSNLTTPAGAIQARYQYDAFGNQRAQVGSSYNRFTFTGHEQDKETNLYYFKARFYDPDTGRFINQDPYLGDIDTPPSLHRYLYAYSNPLVYIDLDGYESVSTMIDNAAEGCGTWSCAGWASLKAVYTVATAGFATVHDPVRDAYDQGKVTGSEYAVKGIGGGLAVTAINLGTARVGGTAIAAATTATGRVATAAAVGATGAAASDAATQGVHISAGVQDEYDVGRTRDAALMGAAFGGGSAAAVEGAIAAKQAFAARAAQQSKTGIVAEGAANETQITAQNTQRPSSKLAATDSTPAEVQTPKPAPDLPASPAPKSTPYPYSGQTRAVGASVATEGTPKALNPAEINYSQRTVSENVKQYATDMAGGNWDWSRSGPIRVMQREGQWVSYDNRRLMAAQQARVESVPVKVVDPTAIMPGSKITWEQAFVRRFGDPRNVANGGVVPNTGAPTQPAIVRPRGK